MRRREFLGFVGGVAAVWPLVARAQQSAMPVIGFLGSGSPEVYANRLRVFHEGLKETGYIGGQNVAILTVRHGKPAIAQFRAFAVAGGLMSYGGSFTEGAQQVGIYTVGF